MAEERAPTAPGERLAMEEVGGRYLRHLEARGRKRATVVGVEMALRVGSLRDVPTGAAHRASIFRAR
jgi:hypothetical protein